MAWLPIQVAPCLAVGPGVGRLPSLGHLLPRRPQSSELPETPQLHCGGFPELWSWGRLGLPSGATLTPVARLGEQHPAVGAGAQLSDEAILATQAPHRSHPGSRQLHQPLEGCSRVLLPEQAGLGVSWAPGQHLGAGDRGHCPQRGG